ncbi:hypothetical protein Ddc_16224 [Ditylenchus destructor]|nr:hypothetical protein Ddc_16224 [Ditylenchus destructor]
MGHVQTCRKDYDGSRYCSGKYFCDPQNLWCCSDESYLRNIHKKGQEHERGNGHTANGHSTGHKQGKNQNKRGGQHGGPHGKQTHQNPKKQKVGGKQKLGGKQQKVKSNSKKRNNHG